MKELIKEAESLYKDIDDIQLSWVHSTQDNDEEGIRFAIQRMNITMSSVFQFLKCIIDRKNNVVDLGEVWKDKSVPFERTELVIVSNYFRTAIVYADKDDTLSDVWKGYKYAYISDLLPKGGAYGKK